MTLTALTSAVALCAVAWSGPALADKNAKGSLLDKPSQRRFYVRAGVLHLVPNVNSGNVVLSNVEDFAQLAIDNGPIENSGTNVNQLTIPAAIVGYVLPYLDGQLSVETVLGTPIELELEATGAMANDSLAPYALGNVPTGVPALGAELGTAKALPPIVTVVYRARPESWLHPYIGVGMSYMHLFDAKVTNPLLTAVAKPTLEVGDAVGFVVQAGLDARIHGRYYATLDLKTILGMNMTAVVHDIYIETPDVPVFEMAKVGDATVHIGMTPLVITLGAGADF